MVDRTAPSNCRSTDANSAHSLLCALLSASIFPSNSLIDCCAVAIWESCVPCMLANAAAAAGACTGAAKLRTAVLRLTAVAWPPLPAAAAAAAVVGEMEKHRHLQGIKTYETQHAPSLTARVVCYASRVGKPHTKHNTQHATPLATTAAADTNHNPRSLGKYLLKPAQCTS